MDPADRYTSHAWMRLEQERLWPRVWLMAGVATDDQIRFRHGPISLDLPDPQVRTEVFAGLTWICLDPDGPDLRTFLGPIAGLLLLLLFASVGAGAGMLAGSGRLEPWLLGLPLGMALQIYLACLLPLLVMPIAYAAIFERHTLSADDLERVRAAARAEGDDA